MSKNRPWLVLIVCVASSAAGCAAKLVPTKGTVTFNGKPLADATVVFNSQEPEGKPASGVTDANGAFELTTTRLKDGALPGTYKVTVHPSETIEMPKGLKKVEDFQQATIRAQPTRKTSAAIPEAFTRADLTPLKHRVPEDGDMKIELRGD